MLGQIGMRIEIYLLLINSNPCDADAYNYLGRAYCEKGEFERACGQKLPVTLKWCEAGFDVPKPKRWNSSQELPCSGGMYMEDSKETLYHAEMRPTQPILAPSGRFEAGVISAGSTARSLGADPLKNGFTPSKETSRCHFLTLTTLRP